MSRNSAPKSVWVGRRSADHRGHVLLRGDGLVGLEQPVAVAHEDAVHGAVGDGALRPVAGHVGEPGLVGVDGALLEGRHAADPLKARPGDDGGHAAPGDVVVGAELAAGVADDVVFVQGLIDGVVDGVLGDPCVGGVHRRDRARGGVGGGPAHEGPPGQAGHAGDVLGRGLGVGGDGGGGLVGADPLGAQAVLDVAGAPGPGGGDRQGEGEQQSQGQANDSSVHFPCASSQSARAGPPSLGSSW